MMAFGSELKGPLAPLNSLRIAVLAAKWPPAENPAATIFVESIPNLTDSFRDH